MREKNRSTRLGPSAATIPTSELPMLGLLARAVMEKSPASVYGVVSDTSPVPALAIFGELATPPATFAENPGSFASTSPSNVPSLKL